MASAQQAPKEPYPLLIGISGPARAGKDTLAGMVIDWAQANRISAGRRAFADTMKLSIARIFDVRPAVQFCENLKTYTVELRDEDGELMLDLSGREFMQRYGTEAHRDVFGQDFWVDQLLPEGWHGGFLGVQICLITDVRFDSEADRIRELGGRIWLVDRDTKTHDAHVSEQGIKLDGTEKRFDNNGILDDLRLQVYKELDRIYK